MAGEALMIEAARGFAVLAGTGDTSVRERNAAHSVAILAVAHASGALREGGRPDWLAEADELDPLRSRADFHDPVGPGLPHRPVLPLSDPLGSSPGGIEGHRGLTPEPSGG